MTHSKPLGSKLLSLLLAFAMILALMPAVSLTAAADTETVKVTLIGDKPQHGDCWTWDGKTLHFFGSGTFDVQGNDSNYFLINSTSDGGAATVDISSSLNVNMGGEFNFFIFSNCAMNVEGAGKVTVTADGQFASLFGAQNITYDGGAICSDSGKFYVFNGETVTMKKGRIEAKEAFIRANNLSISDSYVSVYGFATANTEAIIGVNKSYIETKTLLTEYNVSDNHFTFVDSVLRSSADGSEFTANKKPYFSQVDHSVIYLTEVDSIGWTLYDDLKNVPESQAVTGSGGWVFCDKVLTAANGTANNFTLTFTANQNNIGTELCGVFYDSNYILSNFPNSTDYEYLLDGITLGGGNFFSCNNGYLKLQCSVKNAVIVGYGTVPANGRIRIMDNAAIENSVIAGGKQPNSSTDWNIVAGHGGYETYSINDSKFYSLDDGKISVYAYDENAFKNCVLSSPKGLVDLHGISQSSSCDITRADITAREFASRDPYGYIDGNVCCDIASDYQKSTTGRINILGSKDHDVSIGDTNGYTVYVKNSPAISYEKQGAGEWEYKSINDNYTAGANTALFIGKPVLNTLKDPNSVYNDVTVVKGYPNSFDVELAFPCEDVVTNTEFKLFKDGTAVDPAAVGIIPEVTGSGNKLTLKLSAGETITEGDYTFTFSVNGQEIAVTSGNTIGLKLMEYPNHSMKFGFSSDISWPYLANGELKYFTKDDFHSTVEADTWTWYGEGSAMANGYPQYTLLLKNGFNFTTTAENGIEFPRNDSIKRFTIAVEGDCAINAGKRSVYYNMGNSLYFIREINSSRSALTVNAAIDAESGQIDINGVDVTSQRFEPINSTVSITGLLAGSSVRLQNCKVYAGDIWNNKCAISGGLIISRNVTLDLPASSWAFSASSIDIADIDSVENIRYVDGTNISTPLNAEDSPYTLEVGSLNSISNDQRMTLTTKKFEFIGKNNIVIADEPVSTPDDSCVLGGKSYSIKLSDLINIDPASCTVNIMGASGYSANIEDDNLVITVPDILSDSPKTLNLRIVDSKEKYRSWEYYDFYVTVNKVINADKLGFTCRTNSGDDIYSDFCSVAVKYNGISVEPSNDGTEDCYFVPSGKDIEVTLLPKDGYYLNYIDFASWDSMAVDSENLPVSESATYTIKTTGTDKRFYIYIDEDENPQYHKIDISDDLRQNVSDGDIASITLTYPLDTVKTLDGTLDQFPAYIMSSTNYVTVSMTSPSKSVLSINGVKPDYDSKTGVYSAKLSISKDTEITAQLENLADLCSFSYLAVGLPNTEDKITVTPAPINSLGQYKIGTELEIFANVTEDKFINSADFNGVEIEPYKQGNGGYYYKVTTAAGSNRFVICYTDLSTLNIKKPEHGSVEFSGRLDGGRSSEIKADGTQVYSIGTNDIVTLTITPDSGYQLKSVKLDGDKAPEVTVKNGACSFMMDQSVDWTFTAEFEKKSTGGNTSGGGHYSGGSGTVTKESKPSINGESKSWSDIASDITKNGKDGIITIDLNGETTLPEEIIKAIKDSGATVIVKVDSTKSWTIKGSDIKDGASSADLSLLTGTSSVKGARGSVGYRFSTGGNDVGADLTIQFKPEYAGKFANLYFIRDSKAEFTSTAKVAEDGSATFTGVTAKGEYVVMLSDYSDLPGDVNNDGKVLISDALAALYHCVDIEQAANPAMLDFNGDGKDTIADALAMLRYSVGLNY